MESLNNFLKINEMWGMPDVSLHIGCEIDDSIMFVINKFDYNPETGEYTKEFVAKGTTVEAVIEAAKTNLKSMQKKFKEDRLKKLGLEAKKKSR